MIEICEKLSEKMDIDILDFEKKNDELDADILYLESPDGEKFMLYNCVNGEFNYDYYRKIMEEEVLIPIILFEDWDQERNVFKKIYKNLSLAREKKKFEDIFSRKKSIYLKDKNEVVLEVDNDGINFLEYVTNGVGESLQGYVYNVSFYELKKLYNVTGEDLFSHNVRTGIRNDQTGRVIQKKFRDYIQVHIFEEIKENTKLDANKLLEYLNIDETMLKVSSAQNFWFYHNGITIFSYGDAELNRNGRRIKLNPKEVSVINGAQTLTKFLSQIEEAREELEKFVRENDLMIDVNHVIECVLKAIKIKTIFIHGSLEFVRPITNGLNTQIPILQEDILAGSEEIQEFNKLLKPQGIRILKKGEVSPLGKGYSPLDFAKRYLITVGKPGESKNLRKTILKNVLEQAQEQLNKGAVWTVYFDVIKFVDVWWNANMLAFT